ncbi:type II secretion system protein GspM [Ponticaulis profundi]|uniref:Type II secretion system protein GspM n=1 Tax=Ponticaulis profundi TaxID=2665222 RepID=A0ABW1S6Y5_9PROT
MKSWWMNLSTRERAMLFIAGGLALIFVLYQLIYLPLSEANASAKRAYARQAEETHETLEALAVLQLHGGASTEASAASTSSESLELLLSRTASASGLEIVRLQPGNGALTVWFDRVDARTVMGWMLNLEANQGLFVTSADLREADSGAVLRGSVAFRKAAAS